MPATAHIRLPAAFRRVTLELAREPAHPAGDPADRYILIAPLQADGRLDADLAKAHRDSCRFAHQSDGASRRGSLVHGPGGRWELRYDDPAVTPGEVAFRLDKEHLEAGEYVSVVRKDGDHPYRVTAVAPV